MMLLGNSATIGKVYKFGLMATGFASGETQDFETDYDVKAAKRFLKNEENMTETVDCMFRFNEKYAKSMSSKKYRKIAAICILQGVEFDGCPYWNKKVAEAKKTFVKSDTQENATEVKTEQKTEDAKKDHQVEDEKKEQQQKDKSSTETQAEEKKEDFNAPIIVEPVQQSSETAQQEEKIVDAKPEDVTEVVEFDTDSKFIPKPEETNGKKNAIFDFDKMDVDLNSSGKPTEKYKKAFNKINEVVKAQKPANTKYKLTQLPSGLIELQLMTDAGNYIGTTLFDPYIVYGNRIYMQASSEIGSVVVPLERHDLINKYLSGYTLTAKEAEECRNLIFFNEDIYAYIDMSEVKDFRKMSTDNYRIFGAKLEKVLAVVQKKIPNVPRMRFKDFQNSNKFTLVSDREVKNPNMYPISIKDGVEVKIMGAFVSITIGDETSKFKIA